MTPFEAARTARRRAEALAFVTAFVTLFAQILVHRMASLKLLNNLAFLVISLTMLGFALSGVALSRWLGVLLERRGEVLPAAAAAYAVTLVAASWLFYGAGNPPGVVPGAVTEMPYWMLVSLLFAAPFAFCGLNLGLLLSSPDLPSRRIYAADLAGSALGAFAVIPAISWLGVETSAVWSAAGFVAATCLLAPPRRFATRLAVGVAAAVLALAAARPDVVFRLHYREGSIQRKSQQPGSGVALEHVVWDPLARIELTRIPPPEPAGYLFPSLIGENRRFLARFRKILTQNDNAFTYAVDYDGTPASLEGIEETIYAAAYQAHAAQRPRVLVIGVGGGFDILTALAFDASEVTGIDVNRATLGIVTRTDAGYFRAWVQDPRVTLVAAEGRHYLASHASSFDVLQLSGVDSYSGTPGAANVFSESFLYTREAFRLYLERLTENGILNVMRLEFSPPREMLRALVTAVAALRAAGVAEPERHVVTLTQTNGAFTALLVKKTPFQPAELQRLRDWTARSRYLRVSAAPGSNAARENMYQAFLSLADPAREAAFVRLYPYDVRPAEDDRPFFFKYSRWSHLWASRAAIAFPTLEWSVLLLLGATSVAGALGVLLPLRHFAARGLQAPGAARTIVYFAGTGLGYLAIEVALLQKFGLLLGHPNYALSAVLATLLLASGLGALQSSRVVGLLGGLRFVVYALAGLMLALYLFLFPRLQDWVGLPFGVRLLIVFAAVGPLGLLLGTFVPTALEHLKQSAAPLVPWAWGVNGVASVMAPVLSAAFSMTWGIGALFLSAIPLYLVVALVAPAPARSAS